MNTKWFPALCGLAALLFLVGCSSGVQNANPSYRYQGETYGKLSITLAPLVEADVSKAVRADQLGLEQAILHQLKANGLWDESSSNEIAVHVDSLRVRSAFNAVMFGFMAGSDSLTGTVKLTTAENQLHAFSVNASWALGGMAGGQDSSRLGWLSGKFAELTAQTILGKQTN